MTLAAESSIFSGAAPEMVQESEQPFFFKDAHYIANGATTPNHKALDPLSHLTKRLASAAINAKPQLPPQSRQTLLRLRIVRTGMPQRRFDIAGKVDNRI